MSPQHTPAPWHISTSGQYIRKNDGPSWAAWNICEINLDHDRAEADAQLIVAAPDMLAVCEATLEYINEYAPNESASYHLRRVIAKARGLPAVNPRGE